MHGLKTLNFEHSGDAPNITTDFLVKRGAWFFIYLFEFANILVFLTSTSTSSRKKKKKKPSTSALNSLPKK